MAVVTRHYWQQSLYSQAANTDNCGRAPPVEIYTPSIIFRSNLIIYIYKMAERPPLCHYYLSHCEESNFLRDIVTENSMEFKVQSFPAYFPSDIAQSTQFSSFLGNDTSSWKSIL